MTYEIIFDQEAIGFLNTLEKALKERIFDKIISTKDNPLHFFERLEGKSEYKLRIGDYRVIVGIDQNRKIIEVLIVGHRKNIYKNLFD